MTAHLEGVLAAAALSAAVLTAAPSAAFEPAALSVRPAAAFEPGECVVEIPPEHADRVTCGVLTVPERRDGTSTATIQLPVAIIASLSQSPSPDPLVFPTSGGPGGGSMSVLGYFLYWADWAAADRDIIVVEQRGDGSATPSLDCPELDTEHSIVDGERVSGPDGQRRYLEQLGSCRDRLAADGVDLAAHTSAASAADLADLRAALGYDEWNLYGVSYGARLALTVMRDQPAGLRAVILDGVYPPNVNIRELEPVGFRGAVDNLLAQCAADADCGDRYPDLEQDLLAVLDRLEGHPITAAVRNPVDRSDVAMRIADTDVVRGLFDAFYDADLVRVLPFLIDQLAHGNDDVVPPLAQRNLDFADRFAEGLGLSIRCAEEAPFEDEARREAALAADPLLAHFAISDDAPADCDVWDVPALDALENELVTSDIPTLLTSGGYDPITPRAFSEAAAEGLSNHHLLHFPGMGHGAVWANWIDTCPASIATQFLNDPRTAPDDSCIAAMAPTDFLTSADIIPSSAPYRLDRDLLQDRDPVQLAVVGITLLALAGALVHGLAYGIRGWTGRRREGGPTGAVVAGVTTAALNLAFVGGLVLVLMRTEPLILGFGLPTSARPLLVLPFLALGAAAALVILLVRAWRRGDGGRFDRAALSVTAVAALGFAAWLANRALFIL